MNRPGIRGGLFERGKPYLTKGGEAGQVNPEAKVPPPEIPAGIPPALSVPFAHPFASY